MKIIQYILLVCSLCLFDEIGAQNRSIEFREGNWEQMLKMAKKEKKMIFVDCYTSWCGPCKMLSPVLEKISEKLGDSLEIVKIDIDKYPELANKYEIMSVPTLLFFLNGELIRRETGFMPEEKIFDLIKSDFYVKI